MRQSMEDTYAMIPYFVLIDRQLSYTEKCLYSCILYFNEAGRGCFASNRYLAERFGVAVSTVNHALSKLERLGYIRREVDRRMGTRMIFLAKAQQAVPKALSVNQSCGLVDISPKGGDAGEFSVLGK